MEQNVLLLRIGYRMMQGLCESQNKPLQNYLRDQGDNALHADLLQMAATALKHFCGNPIAVNEVDEAEAGLVLAVMDFMIEMIQGPNRPNQEALAATVVVDVFMK